MALFSLLYASRANQTLRAAGDVEAILDSSRKHNTAVSITGMLVFNGYFFLQCLEGERAAVSKIYHRIATDDRHHDVTLLSARDIGRRSFDAWAMGYVPDQGFTRRIVLKYSETDTFDPASIPAENLIGFLTEISDSLPSTSKT